MAEFQEVSKAYVRMCESYPTCEGCPIKAHGNDLDTCRCSVLKWPEKYESKIILWAEEHPMEYPYMIDILQDIFHMPRGLSIQNIWEWLNTIRISEDVAEKLGVEPKEE